MRDRFTDLDSDPYKEKYQNDKEKYQKELRKSREANLDQTSPEKQKKLSDEEAREQLEKIRKKLGDLPPMKKQAE
jgi:hypothetical protein